MKGRGIRSERETVVRWDEAGDNAHIWTASEPVYRKLKKLGYSPTEDNERSAKFEVPKRDIKLPRPKSEKRSQASRKRANALGNTLFTSGESCRDVVQTPNALQKRVRT
ncbi:MAG: hypothetical protein V3T23_00140 [Nitrososphaerales archaeon]